MWYGERCLGTDDDDDDDEDDDDDGDDHLGVLQPELGLQRRRRLFELRGALLQRVWSKFDTVR